MQQPDLSAIKKSYERDGYVSIPGFLSQEEVDQINRELVDFIKNTLPLMPANYVFYEDENNPSTLKQLQDIQKYNLFFERILNGSRFKEIAEVLLQENVIGKTLEYFNKPAGIGKPTPPHQDNYYFKLEPPQAITMWLALEGADEGNGCVRYIRASHLNGLRPHGRTATLGFSQGITDYAAQDFAAETPFTVKAGDLLVHHAMTIHRADANSSDRSRRAMGFIYFGESAEEDIEAKKKYQEKLLKEREMKSF